MTTEQDGWVVAVLQPNQENKYAIVYSEEARNVIESLNGLDMSWGTYMDIFEAIIRLDRKITGYINIMKRVSNG